MIAGRYVVAETLRLLPELEGDRAALEALERNLGPHRTEDAIVLWTLGVASALCRARRCILTVEGE